MESERTSIAPTLKLDILARNRHRCCVCYQEQVILHHIDKDPGHNVPENLAVLCLHHHGLAHAHFELSQNYTEEVIRYYKNQWESHIELGGTLPASLSDPYSSRLAQQYQRQQTALRIVFAEELSANYGLALDRYLSVGGTHARQVIHDITQSTLLRCARWNALTEVGHLQEYIELMARTYSAIEQYNNNLITPIAGRLYAREWAQWNLRVGTAIAASLTPLLVSLDRHSVSVLDDFNDTKFLLDFPQD